MKLTSRKSRRVTVMVLILAMVSCILTACSTEPENKNPYNVTVIDATSDFYVNDFAGILSEDQKSDMMALAVDLDSEYSGIQVVVTTVESFEKTVVSYEGNTSTNVYDIEQLSYAMYDQYGIGQNDMGILIFFSVGDREVRIETGYQMQTYITDQKSGQLLDNYGMEYFRNDQFADGLVAVQAATINEIKNVVPANWASFIDAEETVTEQETANQETSKPADSSEEKKENDSNGGMLFGLFGSIGAMFAAVGAFIYNLFTGKKKREAEAKAHAAELQRKDDEHRKELAAVQGAHKAKIDQVARKYNSDMAAKKQEIDSLRGQLTMESNRHNDTRRELSALEEKFQRVQTLHPEFDFNQEVIDMIEGEFKASAKEVDDKLSQVVTIAADKDRIEFFTRAKEMFYAAKPEVRKYITTDVKTIEGLLSESVSLKQEFDRVEKEKQDKAVALAMHNKIEQAYNEHPVGSYRNYAVLLEVYSLFNRLTQAQRGYMPDVLLVSKFQKVFEAAQGDHDNYEAAKEAEKSVKSIISRIGSADEDDRDDLARAKKFYTGLSTAEKAYFDKGLYNKLLQLIRDAEQDHEDQERRRRQRRQQSSYSSSHRSSTSSFSSRSSFSGRGGRPSGGGASRRF